MNSTQNYCILVVDDIADNLVLMQLVLESEGYQVELADSGDAAIASIRTARPDLVLLDVMMPDMNGFEVTQRLRQDKDCSRLPIVLLTADRSINFEQALAAGANDIITKPIDMDHLLTRVSDWCR
jgi:CheY-like chemotaxis protein